MILQDILYKVSIRSVKGNANIEINGLHVHRIVDLDGFKFIFHGGSWLGIRFSGTEPIVRLYLEGDSEKQLDVLKKAGESPN